MVIKMRLGKTNLEVNKNGFGALPIQRRNIDDSVEILLHAYENGIDFYDTAHFYTDSEAKLGKAFEDVGKSADDAAKDAQAIEFIQSKEDGYETVVEQRGKNLSGGQKQRVSIARTLIRNPKILILDDSSSALDMATESKLQLAIKERMKDSTVIMIAQRISAVMDADQIIVLDQGQITGIGTHEELLKTNEIYRSIAISQLGEEAVNHE